MTAGSKCRHSGCPIFIDGFLQKFGYWYLFASAEALYAMIYIF